ncbi:hypothetical protein SEA_SORORFAGO_42 [Mycobacterium phage SororFago]|nr:hypothetical protein SEA_SORORFAGO_42 [Mycobacterium phage SororFago]
MRRLWAWLRPKKFRYPYGIPRVENGYVVTTYRVNDPYWYRNGDGTQTLYLGPVGGNGPTLTVGREHG